MTFKALLAEKTREGISTRVVEMNEQELMPGDVTITVDYSTVNYKDAMAISGRVEVIRQFPLIPGIDLAGTVVASAYPGIAVGDRVVANSWGLSQTHHGGYAQKARLKGEWLVKIPAPFSTKDAMAIGTAGYTAMLCVLALEQGARGYCHVLSVPTLLREVALVLRHGGLWIGSELMARVVDAARRKLPPPRPDICARHLRSASPQGLEHGRERSVDRFGLGSPGHAASLRPRVRRSHARGPPRARDCHRQQRRHHDRRNRR